VAISLRPAVAPCEDIGRGFEQPTNCFAISNATVFTTQYNADTGSEIAEDSSKGRFGHRNEGMSLPIERCPYIYITIPGANTSAYSIPRAVEYFKSRLNTEINSYKKILLEKRLTPRGFVPLAVELPQARIVVVVTFGAGEGGRIER
jgi:hypothetical protein